MRSHTARPLAVITRTATVAIAVWALWLLLGVGTAQFSLAGFAYYTSLTNLLGLVWALIVLGVTVGRVTRSGWRGSASVAPRTGAAVAAAIFITMLIYLVILAPTAFTMDSGYEPFTLSDNLVHIVVPSLLILDWALYANKGQLRWTDPLLWALIPYAYMAFALLRPVFSDAPLPHGGTYPYPFLNVDELGAGGVATGIAGLSAAIFAILFLFVALDRWWGRLARRRGTAA